MNFESLIESEIVSDQWHIQRFNKVYGPITSSGLLPKPPSAQLATTIAGNSNMIYNRFIHTLLVTVFFMIGGCAKEVPPSQSSSKQIEEHADAKQEKKSEPNLNGTYSKDGGLTNITVEKLADSVFAVTLTDGKTVSCTLNDNILSGKLGNESVTVAVDHPELTVIAFGEKSKYSMISNEIRDIPLVTEVSFQKMNDASKSLKTSTEQTNQDQSNPIPNGKFSGTETSEKTMRDPKASAASTKNTQVQTIQSLNGNWIAIAEENGLKSLTVNEIQTAKKTLYVKDDQFNLKWSDKEISGKVEYFPDQKPSAVNLSGRLGNRSIVLRGIFEIETDVLRFCYTASLQGISDNQRPKIFNPKEVPDAICVTYQRADTLAPSQRKMTENVETSGEKQISLFDGETLKGWKDVPGWEVRNGTIINTIPEKDLMTVNEFREYELDLEFRLSDKGNSGILLANGEEVQLVDDAFVAEISKKLEKIGKSFNPENLCGAIYNRVAPNSVSYKGANEWNQLKIQVSRGKISVQMNEEEVISKTPIVLRKGSIGLMTDKAGTARFRNIQIQKLD